MERGSTDLSICTQNNCCACAFHTDFAVGMWRLDGKYVRNLHKNWVLTLDNDVNTEGNSVILAFEDFRRKSQLWTDEDGFLVNEVRASGDKKVYLTISPDGSLCITHKPITRWVFNKDGFLQTVDPPKIMRMEKPGSIAWSTVKAYDTWTS